MKVIKEVTEIIGKVPIEARVIKPHYLLHAYMMDIPIGQTLVEDTLFILQTSPKLIEVLYSLTLIWRLFLGNDQFCF